MFYRYFCTVITSPFSQEAPSDDRVNSGGKQFLMFFNNMDLGEPKTAGCRLFDPVAFFYNR